MVDNASMKTKKKLQLHWLIRGYESTRTIFERKVKYGIFNERQTKTLLMVLAGTDLTFEEILGACARKTSKIHNDLLVVQHQASASASVYMFTCGCGNRYFTAEIVEREERQARTVKATGQET